MKRTNVILDDKLVKDCMKASAAIENEISLLHNDKDFNAIEKHFGLIRFSQKAKI